MKPYIIGETAYNHEGNFEYLKRMVNEIHEIGLDAVKYHLLLNANSYLANSHPIIDSIKKWMFTLEQWSEIFNYTKRKGLDIIALCDDVKSIQYINNNFKEIKAIELHASGINDYFLLKESLNFPNQIILGIGGCSIDEIQYAVDFYRNNRKNNIFLMYGFQSYPTNIENINLAKMLKIKELFNLPIGYTDHTAYDDERNIDMSVIAAAMGVNVLEKHYTPDFGVERIDYHSALGKKHMLLIKEKMETYLKAYGNGNLNMSEEELKYGNTGPMKKAVVAKNKIKKGKKISFDNLWFKRTQDESNLKQNQFLQLIGLEAIKDIEEDEIVDFSKVKYEFKEADMKVLTGGIVK